jgi:predicted nucleic acid-binding protein
VIVLDSSFLIGFYNKRDAHHAAASALMDQYPHRGGWEPRDYVLREYSKRRYGTLHKRGSGRNPLRVMLADYSVWFSADRVEALRRQKQPTMEEPPEPELEVDPHEAIRRMFSGEG